MSIIRVRAFDVATFVAHGAAQIGIVGSDVIDEFDYSELYAPVDLGIGKLPDFGRDASRSVTDPMQPVLVISVLRPNIPTTTSRYLSE